MGDEFPKVQQKILSIDTTGISSQYALVLSKKTERTEFLSLIVLISKLSLKKPEKSLNEKIQKKSNKIHLIKDTQKIQGNPKNIMETN